MRKLTLVLLVSVTSYSIAFSQGVNIPSPHWGLSFGNSTSFNGIRFNIVDKDIQKINGINISVWGIKDENRQTGTVRGFQLGILNHVKNNPGGLRWLPIFNTSFKS